MPYDRKKKAGRKGSRFSLSLPKIDSKKGLLKKNFLTSFFAAFFGIFKRERIIKRKKKGIITKLFKFAFQAAILLFVIGVIGVAAVFVYFSKDIPDPNKIIDRSVAQSTKIYDKTGKVLLYEIHGEEKRTIVKIDQISSHLVHATVAAEDQEFYQHHGIDFRGIARALWRDIVAREKLEGGSTITQQLIKNSILTRERTFQRKIKEVILAIETEQKFSKDQIMEMYLNQIPYGSNAYGAEAAAQTYFGKSAKDLDITEAAILASLPRATTYYSPYGTHPEALEARYQYVIDNMLEQGYISEQEAKTAKEEKILTRVKKFEENIKAPHFVMYVKQILADKYGEDRVEKGGLKVYTTIDYDLQLIAEDAVSKGMEENLKYNATNSAFVAIDPKTGQVLAMVGSKDYFDVENQGNFNVAISPRQPGSSFKPFVYATAFKKGYTPDTILFDLETNFGKDGSGKNFIPHNYDGKSNGPVTIRSALARSLNIPAVKTLYLAGIRDSIQTAHDLGITTLNNPNQYGLSLVLGTGEVKLLDIVSAYGVFANEGARNPTTPILRVEDSEGNVLEEYKSDPKQVLDKEVARNTTSILSDNAARTPTFGANSKLHLGARPAAAKTGTTQAYKDGWTIGYTPSLAAGVWVGNNNNKEMKRIGGVVAGAPIWNDFMTRALADKPVEQFTPPQPIVTAKAVLNGKFQNDIAVKIDKACGDKLAGELTPETQIEERNYGQIHDILYYVNKDNPQGEYPKDPQSDPQFANWEAPVVQWAKENHPNANTQPPTEICDLRNEGNIPVVSILYPTSDQIIKDGGFSVKADAFSGSGIDQMDFYFDGNLVGVGKTVPYEIYYRLPSNVSEGQHEVSVKVYDKIGNSAEKKISVVVSATGSIFLKPVVGDSFPYVLSAAASGQNVKSITFYYQLESIYDSDNQLVKKPGTRAMVGQAISPVPGASNLYQVLWDENTDYFIPGQYQISAVLEDESGNTYQSNTRLLQIK